MWADTCVYCGVPHKDGMCKYTADGTPKPKINDSLTPVNCSTCGYPALKGVSKEREDIVAYLIDEMNKCAKWLRGGHKHPTAKVIIELARSIQKGEHVGASDIDAFTAAILVDEAKE